jgi:Bacterial regulatory proteins, luxR family
VLRVDAEGHSGPTIAEQLVLSPASVRTHFEHISEKLFVGDSAAAVAHALRTGLIAEDPSNGGCGSRSIGSMLRERGQAARAVYR